MYSKNMYGLNKNGTFKVWNIAVYMADRGTSGISQPFIEIQHGSENGKLTVKSEWVLEGKQGRTPYEQAVLQAEARFKKQYDKNYRETKEELTNIPLIAMLAKDASNGKAGNSIPYADGVFLSDKLDGLRCLAKRKAGVVTIESRTGQPYSVPHIEEELTLIMRDGDVLDGELYVHGPMLQEINSAVTRTDAQEKIDQAYIKAANALRKYGEGHDKYLKAKQDYEDAQRIAAIRPVLEFRVFDVVDLDTPFVERLENLHNYQFLEGGKVFAIEYLAVTSEEDMIAAHADAVSRGFEGIMIRTRDGLYESGKRSAGLWKYKVFMDAEFQIVDIVADKEGYGVFVLRNNITDETFTCTMGSMPERAEYLENKHLYIGLWIKVQFQSRFKGTLLPQFPTGKMFRECDENGNPVE